MLLTITSLICCLECNENRHRSNIVKKNVNKNSELENGLENGFYRILLGLKHLKMDHPSVAKVVEYSGPVFGLKKWIQWAQKGQKSEENGGGPDKSQTGKNGILPFFELIFFKEKVNKQLTLWLVLNLNLGHLRKKVSQILFWKTLLLHSHKIFHDNKFAKSCW